MNNRHLILTFPKPGESKIKELGWSMCGEVLSSLFADGHLVSLCKKEKEEKKKEKESKKERVDLTYISSNRDIDPFQSLHPHHLIIFQKLHLQIPPHLGVQHTNYREIQTCSP